MQTYKDLKNEWLAVLNNYYGPEETHALLCRVTDYRRSWSAIDLLINQDQYLTTEDQNWYADVLKELSQLKPIQYILGETYFYGHCLTLSRDVLIPRPETEELVDLIIKKEASAVGLNVLDIGTGSGAIAVSLKLGLTGSHLTAWDISPKALRIAKSNAIQLGAAVCFEEKNVLTLWPQKAVWDVIVSNPPYVCMSEKAHMRAHVLTQEPDLALFVPDDEPLLFYQKIAELGLSSLLPNGRIYFEINAAFGQETQALLMHLGYHSVSLINDSYGKPRIVSAVRP